MKKFNFLCLLMILFCAVGMKAADVKELVFSNVSLTPGSKLEALQQDQQITFNTNMDAEIGYMYAEIQDVTDENNKQSVLGRTTVYDPNFNSTGVKDDKNPKDAPQNKKDPYFTFVCPATTTMTEGHTYAIVFKAFTDKAASTGKESPLAEGTIEYVGATAAYVGSSIKLLSITPDPETFIISDKDNRSVTLNFSGKVRMDEKGTFVNTGFGSSAAFESIVPGEDAEKVGDYTFSTSWTLTPKTSTISDGNDVIFVANAFDMEGLHVCEGTDYSTGADASSYYTFTVANDLGKDAFTAIPKSNDPYVNSLYSFKVECGDLGIAQAGVVEPAVLYQVNEDETKTEVAKIVIAVDDKVKAGDPTKHQDDLVLAQRLFLDKQITKAGKYVLHFPRGYFNFGNGMDAGSSAATDFEYTIAEDFVAPTVKVAGSTEVKKLAKIEIQYPDYDEVAPSSDADQVAYILDSNNQLVTKASLEICWDHGWDANYIDVNLKTPVTSPGTYKLIIPQDQICVAAMEEDFARKNGAKGGYTPGDDDVLEYTLLGAFVQEFSVLPGSIEGVSVKTDIESGSTVAKIDAVKLVFESATGEDVVVESTHEGQTSTAMWKMDGVLKAFTDVAISGNVVTIKPFIPGRQKDTYGLSDDGTYTITFDKGFFAVNGQDWPEITLIYTVDTTATGINNVNAADATAAKQVYTLTGIKVNGNNAKDGIFIVNGKKVVLK